MLSCLSMLLTAAHQQPPRTLTCEPMQLCFDLMIPSATQTLQAPSNDFFPNKHERTSPCLLTTDRNCRRQAIRSRSLLGTSSSTNRHTSSSSETHRHQLRNVLEEYQLNHHTYEIPTRFKKDIVVAACETKQQAASKNNNNTGKQRRSRHDVVRLEGLEAVLKNIGVQDRISHGDWEQMYRQETGAASGAIEADRLRRML
mmetsp:Transcript_444/g.1240  ORF Transcript_444/g.1240 Transcript_444/m.1240 type:complete len:200 (+) Transcript_444:110-709(+)